VTDGRARVRRERAARSTARLRRSSMSGPPAGHRPGQDCEILILARIDPSAMPRDRIDCRDDFAVVGGDRNGQLAGARRRLASSLREDTFASSIDAQRSWVGKSTSTHAVSRPFAETFAFVWVSIASWGPFRSGRTTST
jgi:hypothetical protein